MRLGAVLGGGVVVHATQLRPARFDAPGVGEAVASIKLGGPGAVAAAEGPHLGSEGAVGGFMVLEAEDLDAAVALAARVPAARHGGAVEVRPAGGIAAQLP